MSGIVYRRGMPLSEFRAMMAQRQDQPCAHPFDSVTRHHSAKRLKTDLGRIAFSVVYHCTACETDLHTETKSVKT